MRRGIAIVMANGCALLILWLAFRAAEPLGLWDSRRGSNTFFSSGNIQAGVFLRLRANKNSSCGCARKRHFRHTPQAVSLITPASGSEIGR